MTEVEIIWFPSSVLAHNSMTDHALLSFVKIFAEELNFCNAGACTGAPEDQIQTKCPPLMTTSLTGGLLVQAPSWK